MKTNSFIIATLLAISCTPKQQQTTDTTPIDTTYSVSSDTTPAIIRFCESVYPLDQSLLIGNFGTEQLDPLNQEGKGYIVSRTNEEDRLLIPADGNLNAPKGMYEQTGYLYIADVNKIVVYNLKKRDEKPQIIQFPSGEMFVNDLAAKGKYLYATVTNTGKIFAIDISNPTKLAQAKPWVWRTIPGANGILIDGERMFVASYPPDGKTKKENGIYLIENLSTDPKQSMIVTLPGQYDGLALDKAKQRLYFSNWQTMPSLGNCQIGVVELSKENKISGIAHSGVFGGAADFCFINNELVIPDLPNSEIIYLKNINSLQ